MIDTFNSNDSPARGPAETSTGWAIVLVGALLPFTAAYVIAGINPEMDGQFIAAIVGLFILLMAVVVNIASVVIRKVRHIGTNDHWVY